MAIYRLGSLSALNSLETPMSLGKTLFAQLMDFLPWKTFLCIVDRHDGDRYVKPMTCAAQLRATLRSVSQYSR